MCYPLPVKHTWEECTVKQNRTADMHLHTFMSDGTNRPEDIMAKAKGSGTGIIALSDHQSEYFNPLMAHLCREAGIAFIPGMELECRHLGANYHMLAYCTRPNDPELTAQIQRIRGVFIEVNRGLIRDLAAQGHPVSVEECETFPCRPEAGGWRTRQYLVAKGIAKDMADSVRFYAGRYEAPDFPEIGELVQVIHKAGGVAVLAHPMAKIPGSENIATYKRTLNSILDAGADGVETYYPGHTEAIIRETLAICKDRKKLITAGSDCHNREDFSLGKLGITEDRLELGDLLERNVYVAL